MSLKAQIRNLARQKDMSPQVVLQNYMFERFLMRLAASAYRDRFVLKGGMLIAAMVGIENRATMDMDATIRDYPVNSDSVEEAIKEICGIEGVDRVHFSISGVRAIREEDDYGGFRVSLVASFEGIITKMHIDITTGDAITPKASMYLYHKIFEKGHIGIWAYNVETILAEKAESIIKRGELNTRPRDFYDIYILTKTQDVDLRIFKEAIAATVRHRKSLQILQDYSRHLEAIRNSTALQEQWLRYTKDYGYAAGISYEEIMVCLAMLLGQGA